MRRSARLLRNEALGSVAEGVGASPAEVALAWVLSLSPALVAIPGARRPETARSVARAAGLELTPDDRAALTSAFGSARPARRARTSSPSGSEVVLVMGIPGAGKSRVAEDYTARGYLRLNRDERGGSLRELAGALNAELAAGATRIVLDNTYLTRASRSHALEEAARHGAATRCVWLDTPLAQAQINLVERLLDRVGSLPSPDELRELARREPGILAPTSQMRTLRELEPPSPDEGFASVEQVSFERVAGTGGAGILVAAAAMEHSGWERALAGVDPATPCLLFHWSPGAEVEELDAEAERLRAIVSGPVETALCPHGGGPPVCWCRPPLPGLPLEFARGHGVDPARSTLVGAAPAHRTLAAALGAGYVDASGS